MKKSIAAICVLACILGSFAGCGNQAAAPTEEVVTQAPTEAVTETTAPQISEETLLIMELMGNYLNMEPKREFTEYKFGLRTTKWDLPVALYEDCAYTKNEGAIYVSSFRNPYGYGSVKSANDPRVVRNETDAENTRKIYEEYPQYISLDMDKNYSYGFQQYQKQDGARVKKHNYYDSDFVYQTFQSGFKHIFYAFSILPKENFEGYMSSILANPEQTEAFFTLSQEEIFYMQEKQKYEFETFAWFDIKYPNVPSQEEMEQAANEIEEKLENGEIKTPAPHNCYVIQYDIDSKYQNVNAPHMISDLFMRPYKTQVHQDYPRTRLDDGMLHVALYFDQETRQCVMEKIDATDCAGPMLKYLISLGDIKEGDNTYIIQNHYSDAGATDPQQYQYRNGAAYDYSDALKETDLYQNKIVYQYFEQQEYDVVTVDKYEIRYDVKNEVYKIFDGTNMIAVVDMFGYGYNEESDMIGMSHGMEIENKDDFNFVINEIKMSDVVDSDNKNNEDVGYAVVASPMGITNSGIEIFAWNEDILRDVVDHMTFVHTDDPAAA